MIYKSGKNGYYKSYEYAKSILNKMNNITSFKAFSTEDHDYYEVIDNNRNYYNLIIFDENSNEYWFDTNCGYKGMGSVYSEKILRLVGIRENHNIVFEKEIHKNNLTLNNKLNLLVVEIDLSSSIEKYFIKSLISLDFKDAYSRYNVLDELKSYGVVKSINDAVGSDLYVKYFGNCELENDINNVLFLDSYLDEYIKLNISNEITDLLGIESYIDIKEINKIEYGIYNY